MSLLDALRYRWRTLTRPNEHAADLAQDMDFFVDAETRQRAHAGQGAVSEADARAAAVRRFGNRTYYREEVRRVSGRERIDVILQDVRFALRTFARTPGFTAIAVGTLAIGIGANTAIFSAVNTLMLSPLPFHDPQRLMNLTLTIPPTSDSPGADDIVWSYPKVEVFRANQNVFSDLTAWFSVQSTLKIGEDASRVEGEFIDQHYFATLGVVPSLGRALLPTENRVDGPPVVVISDAMWRSTFGADPDVIGKQFTIDLANVTVVGVAPPGFTGVSGQAQFWVPFLSAPPVWDATYFPDPYQHRFHVIGRLAPGVSPERASALSHEIGPRIDALYPDHSPRPRHWGVAARTLDATRIDDGDRRTLFLLSIAVGFVLLVACANVASLFLVRAASRRREIAVRLAIGASRARLVRQLLVESVVLAIGGGIASLVVAEAGVRVISFARPALLNSESSSGIGTAYADPIHIDLATLAFTAAMALLVGMLFGLLPAIQATNPELTSALKTDSGTATRSAMSRRMSMRDALTAFEIALAVVLLAGSGVLVRSLVNLISVNPGFEPSGVLTARVNRAQAWSRDSITRFYDVALDRLRTVPGVTHAALVDCSPQSGGCQGQGVTVLDGTSGPHTMSVDLHWATAGWNDVLRVPVLRGRSIEASDVKNTPLVAVVSQTAAHTLWPNDDAIGKQLVVQDGDTARIVGIVGDVRYFGLQSPPVPDVYISYYQVPMSFRMMFLVRTSGDPAGIAEAVRRAVREVAPGFPVYNVATLEARIGGALGRARFLAQLLSVFAALALVLATLGTYGVISYAVARRTREMGIRIALGATQRDLIRLVVGQGVVLAATGGVLGLAGAFASVRLIRQQLYDVQPADPITLVGIVVVLMLAVVVASWIPARRAARIPAVEALRAG